jgi:hypothetical protein
VSLSVRWHRLEAAAWVHRLLCLQAVVAGLATVAALVACLALGAPWIVLLPAAFLGLTWWLAQAWDDEKRWSWWVVLALTGLGAGSGVLGPAAGISAWRPASLSFEAVLLVLLAHPDSTARLDRPRRPEGRRPETPSMRPPSG